MPSVECVIFFLYTEPAIQVYFVTVQLIMFNFILEMYVNALHDLSVSRRRSLLIVISSCLINAQPLPAHRPAGDDNEMGSDQSAVRSSFGSVLLLNQIYLTTMCRSTIPLRFI